MRVAALIFVCTFFAAAVGCQRKAEQKFVVYDEWWAADYAEGSCHLSTQPDCREDARSQEADFLSKFSVAFATDPACSGVHLVTYKGPNSSSEEHKPVSEAYDSDNYVTLMVSFTAGYDKQSWMLARHDRSHAIGLRGEGSATQISHEICAVLNSRGGTIN